MQVTISIIKGKEENTYNAKFGTSRGGGQERIRDASPEEVGKKLAEIIKKADKDGYIRK